MASKTNSKFEPNTLISKLHWSYHNLKKAPKICVPLCEFSAKGCPFSQSGADWEGHLIQ